MAHSPGPWRVEFGDTIYAANNPKIIAVVENDVAEYEANAHLIEAAPDLLEALKKLQDLRHQWRHDDQFTSIDYMDAIDALPWESAIAKAEGK